MPEWFLIFILITPGHEPVTIRHKEPLTEAQCWPVGKLDGERMSRAMPGTIVSWTCIAAGEAV